MSTRAWIVVLGVGLLALGAGWLLRGRVGTVSADGMSAEAGATGGPCPGGAAPAYWKAPMDPTYIRKKPGKSPMGMDLVPVCKSEGDEASEGAIHIDSAMIQNMGVRTAPVKRGDLSRKIRAVGRVDYDERLVAHVHPKVQGWIEKLYIDYEGQMVERGQPLLELYSPELVSTQEELLVASRYRQTIEQSPVADVARGGRELFEATRRRLELWDIPDRDIDRLLRTHKVRKTLTLYAPSRGVVTHLMVREGMEVGPKHNLYRIGDLSHVWIYADIYEYELPWIRPGQHGVVELSYLPGRTFEGEVSYVYPYLDPKTRTARVRLEIPNPDGTLKPDMFANVTIETRPQQDVLMVPEESVIRSGRRNLVVLALDKGNFRPRDVELGLDSGDGWLEIRSGLDEGDRVVTSGQFLIDSESKLQEAVQKMLSSGDSEEPATQPRADKAPDMPGMKMEPGMKMPEAVPGRGMGME